ncbi:MAG: SDR family oxidoreductase [Rhizobiaceae bacterium]|jgi:NAD(P)-dependent dehydrogenase (short-subunit alcohol dehydrogenase family)|nr:SDR family oxidoreductase [Rhizobiaceae bacterium]
MSLEKKVAIVTGAAQGIGYAIAKRFLREKARVIIADVDEKAGQEAISALTKIGNARYVHCDVAQRLDVHNLVAGTIDEYGRIDVLVNNAGIVSAGDFLTLSEEEFDRVMAVNLKGAFLCSQAVARHMVNQVGDGMEAGSIINISSINAVYALADQVPYSVSKGGLNQLTRVAAQSLAKYGIRVNAIGPGSISTQMLESVMAENADAKARILSRTPMGRTGEPREIAAIAAFLASDDASYITGQTIYADGGRLGLNYTVPVED